MDLADSRRHTAARPPRALRTAPAAAAALAAGILLAGCSDAGHARSEDATAARASATGTTPAAHSGKDGDTDGGATSGGTGGDTPQTRAPRPAATAWPTRPATADRIPPDYTTAPMAHGYSGASFVTALARTWHITVPPRKKVDIPGHDPVWTANGLAHPAKNQTIDIDLLWDGNGDLKSVSCRATGAYTAFLRDCVRLDYPGAKPQAAADWLAATTPSVDAAFTAASGVPVVSPLFRNGRTVTHLDEQNVKEYGGLVRIVGIFGTPPGAAL